MKRSTPHPLAACLGRRVRALRLEQHLSLEQLAERSQLSKARLVQIERGLVMAHIGTFDNLARGLGVKLFDLFTFPKEGGVQWILDATRNASPAELAALEEQMRRLAEAAKRIDDILDKLKGTRRRQSPKTGGNQDEQGTRRKAPPRRGTTR